MNIFITTASLLNEATISHLGRCGYNAIFSELVNSITFEGFVMNRYDNYDDLEHIHIWDGAVSICCTPSIDLIRNASIEAESILAEYTKTSTNRSVDHLQYSLQYSCILYDVELNHLHVISDSVGSIPIWYSFQQKNLIVSTDYLGLYYSGYTYPSALGSGQRMEIDMKNKEIISISHSLSENAMIQKINTIDYMELTEAYTRNIFVKSMQAIEYALNDTVTNTKEDKVLFTMELDLMEPSSILLDCISDSMKLNRAIRKARPIVMDGFYTDESLVFTKLLNAIPDSFINEPVSSAREIRIAIDRWNLCLAAANGHNTLISFDLGLKPRPTHIYFQNLLCYILNVKVLYPFHTTELQNAIWSNIHPKSYLYDAVSILQTKTSTTLQAMCHSVDSYEDQGSIRTWTMNDLIPCTQESCIDQKFYYLKQPLQYRDKSDDLYKQMVNNYYTNENISIIYHPMNQITSAFIYKEENSFLNLWNTAKKYMNEDRIIILLLVTKDYQDILTNFLCSIHAINIKNVLIITQDDVIKDIAHKFQVGYYSPDSNKNKLMSADFGTISYQQLVLYRTECALELLLMGLNPIIADIDTVWKSNPLNHIPWSKNYNHSLDHFNKNSIHSTSLFDIAIVDDSGEVCGCFVALHYRENTIKFWRQVVILHRELVYNSLENPNQYKFDDSEQKILTNLIYKGKYQGGTIQVATLPSIFFPSGFVYFSTHSYQPFKSYYSNSSNHTINNNSDTSNNTEDSSFNNVTVPSIIHNNFIIGQELKQTRFQRYGLWNINPIKNNISYHSNKINSNTYDSSNNKCLHNYDNIFYNWKNIFSDVKQDHYMPSININSPIHNSILNNQTNDLMLFVSLEGPLFINNTSNQLLKSSKNYQLDFIATRLQISSDPPKYILSSPFLVTKYSLSQNNENSLHTLYKSTLRSFTLVTSDPKISISVDISLDNRQHFGIDGKNLFYLKAMEKVLYNQRLLKEYQKYDKNNIEIIKDGTGMDSISWNSKNIPYLDLLPNTDQIKNNMEHLENKENPIEIEQVDSIVYKIIVITYNRSKSLHRLLQSLANADYMNHKNIDLYINIDGYKSILDKEQVINCKLIADTFQWNYGSKYVTLRNTNIGLIGQWYHAWSPENNSEIAFIFEDDIEVSPYYFRWAFKATKKYYQSDDNQRYLHHQLLNSIEQEILLNSTKQEYKEINQKNEMIILNQTPLERFLYLTAGKPIIYGICLQKQSLDPHHYPQKLMIRNGYQPYLYSLIGSWGPMMYPIVWKAFKLWWDWKYHISQNNSIEEYDISTEDLVTNYFYSNNKKIWTPWHIRFTYETAIKCLYSNLPDDYALVINHREPGENYASHIGPDHQLLTKDHFPNILEYNELLIKEQLSYQPTIETLLVWSYHNLPDISYLSSQQYDFNIRRIGSIFSDSTYIIPYRSDKNMDSSEDYGNKDEIPNELKLRYKEIDISITKYLEIQKNLQLKLSSYDQITKFKRQHWIYIYEMLQSNLLPHAKILHLGMMINPILSISSPHDFYDHYVYNPSSFNMDINNDLKYDNNNLYPIKNIFNLQSFEDMRLSLVLIDLQYFMYLISPSEINNNNSTSTLIWDSMLFPVEYILVLDICSNAPTDFSIEYKQYNLESTATSASSNTSSRLIKNKINYTIVEDICMIGNEIFDKGAVLYRISKDITPYSHSHSHHRVALSRRIVGSYQSRRIIDGTSIK